MNYKRTMVSIRGDDRFSSIGNSQEPWKTETSELGRSLGAEFPRHDTIKHLGIGHKLGWKAIVSQ